MDFPRPAAALSLLFIAILGVGVAATHASAQPRGDGGATVQYLIVVKARLPESAAATLGFDTVYMRVVSGSSGNLLTDIYPTIAIAHRGLLSRMLGSVLDAVRTAEAAPGQGPQAGSATLVYVYSDGSRQEVYKCQAPLREATLRGAWGTAVIRHATLPQGTIYAEGTLVTRDSSVVNFTYSLTYYQGPQPPCGKPASPAAKTAVGALSLAIMAGAAYSALRRPRPRMVRVVVQPPY